MRKSRRSPCAATPLHAIRTPPCTSAPPQFRAPAAPGSTGEPLLTKPIASPDSQEKHPKAPEPPQNAGVQPALGVPSGLFASSGGIAEYISSLKASQTLAPQITGHTILPAGEAHFGSPTRPWPKAVSGVLEHMGIPSLYSHQAQAVDSLRSGRSVIVATPTASGKSLVYTLPVLERFLQDPDARALFLFPLKALAQDQLASFTAMTAHWPEAARPKAAVYDGDTSPHFRKKLRDNPPQALLTNPEMLHLSLLPHHNLWTTLFAGLSLVVVDEAGNSDRIEFRLENRS